MWKGRVLEFLGIWLIVAAFMHQGSDTTALINLVTGGAAVIVGASLKNSKPWQGVSTVIVGALLFFLAFVPSLRIHQTNLYIGGTGGLLVWFFGWRIVTSEKGGPWRLKDRPVI